MDGSWMLCAQNAADHETMDVIMVGPWMLSLRTHETQTMDVRHHGWAMDALSSERVRPRTLSYHDWAMDAPCWAMNALFSERHGRHHVFSHGCTLLTMPALIPSSRASFQAPVSDMRWFLMRSGF